MTKHRLLIVSPYFAPAARIGGRRADKLAEAFLKQGWEVDVLTLDEANSGPADPGLKGPKGVGRLTAKPWTDPVRLAGLFSRTVWESVEVKGLVARLLFRGWPTKLLMRLAGALGLTSPYMPWEGPAARALGDRRYAVVLATVPPSSAAVIAARHSRRCGALLYIDYRDPWHNLNYYDMTAPLARYFRRLNAQEEKACIDAARRVVTVSPTLGRWAEQKTETPVYLLPHGYVADPDRAPYSEPLDLPDLQQEEAGIVLYYVGALLYDRDLGPLYTLARDIERLSGRCCRVLYSGMHENLARDQAERVGAADLLISTGAISHPQVNDLMRRVTVNVVVISPGYEYQYPGKLWDAVAAKRPILLMGVENCDSAQLVESRGLGIVIPPGADIPVAEILDRLRHCESTCVENEGIADLTTDRLYAAFVETVTDDLKTSITGLREARS